MRFRPPFQNIQSQSMSIVRSFFAALKPDMSAAEHERFEHEVGDPVVWSKRSDL
jgi:hypothetical protein